MKKLPQILLFLTLTLLLSYYLPEGWRLLTPKRLDTPALFYSDISGGFFSPTRDPKTGSMLYKDTAGRLYSRSEYESLLPLMFHLQLHRDGRMPAEINGVKTTASAIRRDAFILRLRPRDLDAPQIHLYPLFDNIHGREKLEAPRDFIRVTNRVEFLDPETNRVIPGKSALFDKALRDAGFRFPPKSFSTNPTAKKPYDEGLWLLDAAGAPFRLHQTDGVPDVTNIQQAAADKAAWAALEPRYIQVVENQNHEIRALIINNDATVWLVAGDDYRLRKLPLPEYNSADTTLIIRGSLLHYQINTVRPGALHITVLNRAFEKIAEHHENLPRRDATAAGKLERILFPISWKQTDPSTAYLGFYPRVGPPPAFLSNALLLALFLIVRRLKDKLPPPILESAFILFAGLPALIAALLTPAADFFPKRKTTKTTS